MEVNMQLQLTNADTAVYTSIDETARIRIKREIKIRTEALKFNLISRFHLIAGFKAEIRAKTKDYQLNF